MKERGEVIMGLNKTIIMKIRAKTEHEPEIGEFLVKLLECENESPGWYKTKYNTILDNACKEEKKDANNKY
jgi:hypothetical protein